jgi:hypothetical protein
MWIVVLGSKGEATVAIRRVQAAAAEFVSYYADEGVQHHYSMLYSPQQNDIVEWHNQMVVGMAQALLK